MIGSRSGLLYAGLVLLGVVAGLASGVSAGTPSIKEKGKVLDTVEFLVPLAGLATSEVLFTVPASRQLVVTDVHVSNTAGTAATAQRIWRNGSDVGRYSVQADDTLIAGFRTGLRFGPGDTLQVRNGANSGTSYFFVSGYVTKASQ